ncbi:phosphoserine transaminase [Propionibacteriaceae bacterium Y1923]
MTLRIPTDLLPRDGRFGSGPAKVRPEAAAALATSPLLGTSHRQPGVKNLVGRIREQAAELYQAPEGYELVLGNGGATMFWDVASCSLVTERSAHGVYGEFSRKFAAAAQRAPFLAEPVVFESEPGTVVLPTATEGVDLYAWAQNETSTGAAAPVVRPEGTEDGLVLVDATSSAGGMAADLARTDVYYFAPQKNLSSDGGLWLAFCSPAALARAEELTTRTDRWVPESLNLAVAATNSRANQTLNTPAVATLVLLAEQLQWVLDNGGMGFATGRTAESSGRVYAWAEAHELATPFVAPEFRSPVVATIDFADTVDAKQLAADLRANGILDTEPYRKLGRNQLRIGCFTSVDPDDVSALLASIDWLLGQY